MAGISNYLADKINDWLHGNTAAYTPPGTTYFALMTAMPSASGGGTEVTGGSYARVAVTNNSTNWPASVNGFKSNGTAVTWPTPTADWGNIVGIAEYDASSGGNLLTFADLDPVVTILDTQIFSMPATAIVFTWAGGISQYLMNRLNDWLHGGGSYTVPTTTYFALMSTIPTESTPGTETTGGSYARPGFTNNATDWPNSVAQTKANAVAITWPTASTAWSGPEVAVAEYDAVSSGNLLTFGPLANSVSVGVGATPSVPINGGTYQVQ